MPWSAVIGPVIRWSGQPPRENPRDQRATRRPNNHLFMSQTGADAAVHAVFSVIADALLGGETVTIAGFGTFSTKSRPGVPGSQSPSRRKHRHHSIEPTIVQGWQDLARRRQLVPGLEVHFVTPPEYGPTTRSIRRHRWWDAEPS